MVCPPKSGSVGSVTCVEPSLIFQRNFMSFKVPRVSCDSDFCQPVSCSSPPAVLQGPPPRACPRATEINTSEDPKQSDTAPASFRMTNPPGSLIFSTLDANQRPIQQ